MTSRAEQIEGKLRVRFAKNVRKRRLELELTQEEASELGGLHPRHWQKVEAGDFVGSFSTLARVAVALRADPLELLSANPKP